MTQSSAPVQGRSIAGSTAVDLSLKDERWRADLSASMGGSGQDPDPHDLLDSALVACTILTVQMYAKRKQYPLESVQVSLVHDEDDAVYRMDRRITLGGALSQQQKDDLLRVANACPLHKALHKKFEITTALAS
ncbi:OsmC family protein [Ramlibacter alkalitolerans]|uniref:OsmC family protein n=1 Tax=Ramlibacter alkalitolerans TaxID=2039631 RepID=A0ABS1JTU4_9BURK|nr:OsmC family protein [Ramlibacter alkalitolerans]MBL0427276.1 OsmC family protein [Ramlibacter alkalitolerans]